MDIIKAARRERSEEQLFSRWISGYQRVMSFKEFKQQLGIGQENCQQVKMQTAEEILSDVRGILDGDF